MCQLLCNKLKFWGGNKLETGLSFITDPNAHTIVVCQESVKETYALDTTPPPTSSIVLQSKKEILQKLQLETIISNLNNSAGLMFVAYNALAGTQLQSKMSGLQKDLLDLCQNCIVAVQDFESKSDDVMRYIVLTYKYLLKGKEDIALKQLIRCGQRASEMAAKSEELAAGFTTIAKSTEQVLESSQDEENKQYQRIQELQAQLRELDAKQESAKVKQEELVNQITEMQQLYDDAKSREEKEDKRQFALGIVSAVTSAIGSGVAAYVSVTNPLAKAVSSISSSDSKTSEANPEDINKLVKQNDIAKVAAEKLSREAQEKSDAYMTAQKEADAAVADANTAHADAEQKASLAKDSVDETVKKAAEDAKNLASEKLKTAEEKKNKADELQKDADAAKKLASDKNAEAAGLAAALAEVSKSTAKMQEQASNAAASIQQEKLDYMNKKLEMQKESREALAALAEYAKLIENTNVSSNMASTAVETLHVAVRSLKQIVTALATAALFWRSMEQYCQNLSKSKLVEEIDDYKDMEINERLEEYSDPAFMYTLVLYLGHWVALNEVCKDYLTAVNEAYVQVTNNINSAPSVEQAWNDAPKLAKNIFDSVQNQIIEIDTTTKAIEAEKESLVKANN